MSASLITENDGRELAIVMLREGQITSADETNFDAQIRDEMIGEETPQNVFALW